MAIAGFVLAIVAVCVAVAAAAIGAFYVGRVRRVSIAQTALILARLEELEADVRQVGENHYVIARTLLEKGIVDEDELEKAFTVFVEEARAQAREHAALLKEWRERADTDGVLVEETPKTAH